jgi:hypothetical protein
VKLDGAFPTFANNIPSSTSDTTSATSKSIPSPLPLPISPFTTIRAVRNQLSTLESKFNFPAVLSFDRFVFAVSPNNAPLHAYENTLSGLLEQTDVIESDGNGEVRNVRRAVVRVVEKALEDLERMVGGRAPKQVTGSLGVNVKGCDIEVEELEALAAQDAVPFEAILVQVAEPAVESA